MGKETLEAVVGRSPTGSRSAYQDLVFVAWAHESAELPDEVRDIRAFVDRCRR